MRPGGICTQFDRSWISAPTYADLYRSRVIDVAGLKLRSDRNNQASIKSRCRYRQQLLQLPPSKALEVSVVPLLGARLKDLTAWLLASCTNVPVHGS